MIPLSDVVWGPINATENDARFSDKWIEPAEIKNCLEHSCWVVSGEKGSGKSAIQRAMREIYSSEYYATPLVDFDKVTFGLLYRNLMSLSETTTLSAGVTLSNYWQYAIVIELLQACARTSPSIYGDLLRNGPAARHEDIPLNQRLMRLLQESWTLVENFTSPGQTRANLLASGSLSADLLHKLSIFPLGPDYKALKREFFKRVEANQHRATLILDGFDTLITDEVKPASIHLIFSSLLDAILSLRKDESLPSFIGLKALIPHDRYVALSLRDLDKVSAMHTAIRWNGETLREFVGKRIAITPSAKRGAFQSMWNQVFPEQITNAFCGVEEDSFDYVLRHTMLRPRQLQIHLGTLAETYRGLDIHPSMVPESIKRSSKDVARFFIEEYRLDHPNLEGFILMFHKKSNIMTFKEFRERVATGIKRWGKGENLDVDEKVDILYAIGLFGIVRFVESDELTQEPYYPPSKGIQRHYVDFFFRKPFRNVSARLDDDSLVALHPVFVDFAELRADPSLVIG